MLNQQTINDIYLKTIAKYGNVARGYGILSLGNADALVVRGPQTPNPSSFSFDNCTYGILSERSHTDIYDVTMNNVFRGIDVEVSQNLKINIEDNTLNCIGAGIFLYNNAPIAKIKANRNTININLANTYAGGTGINSRDFANTGSDAATLEFIDNTLALSGTFSGIWLENQHYAEVINNTITTSNATGNSRGIRTSFGGDLVFKDNTTLNNGADNSSTAGFFIQNTTNTAYCCNTTGGWLDGLVFLNDCSSSPILGTEIQTNRRGWFMNGPISQQVSMVNGTKYHHGNRFTGNYALSGAYYANDASIDLQTSRIFVTPNNSVFRPNNVGVNAGDPDNWFSPDNQAHQVFNCTTGPDCEALLPQIMQFNDIDEAVAAGELLLSSWKTGLNWGMNRNLYQKTNRMNANGELTAGSIFEAFYLQHASSTIGQLYNIETGIQQLFTLSTEEKDSLDFFHTTETTLMNLIEDLQSSLLNENLSIADSLLLVGQTKIAYGTWHEIAQRRKALMQIIWQERRTDADALIALNNDIPTTEGYEQNEQTVHTLFLQTIAKGINELTAEQTVLLQDIANQCPETGGIGVIRAKSLLMLNRNTIANDYPESCDEPELRENNASIAISETDFTLFPNPTQNSITLKTKDNASVETMTIQIFNIIGQEVMSIPIEINTASIELDINKLNAGIYFFKILSNQQAIYTQKVVVY